MVELKYVKKRKRRRKVAIVTTASFVGLSILGIVAFLGRHTGTFTVALDTGDVSLSLSKTKDFSNPTSFIRLDQINYLDQSTYQDQDANELDNEASNNKNFEGALFKLTFYIKNVSNVKDSSVKYYLNINLTENHKTVDSDQNEHYLDDFLRIRVFENDAESQEHSSTTYARKRNQILKDSDGYAIKDSSGNDIWQEYIPLSSTELNERRTEKPNSKTEDPTYYYGLAQNFEYSEKSSDSRTGTVASYTTYNFNPGDIKRYTIVFWLEGEDPDCIGNHDSWSASTLKLGVTINGYENK